MAFKKPVIEKHFYSIGEVAEMFSVKTSLIRYWEKEFDYIKPYKNKKGNRLFTPENIEELKLIFHLVKERGMTLDGAKKKIKQNKGDEIPELELVQKLKNIRELLLEIKNEL